MFLFRVGLCGLAAAVPPWKSLRVLSNTLNKPRKTLKSFIKLGDALTLSLAKRVAADTETVFAQLTIPLKRGCLYMFRVNPYAKRGTCFAFFAKWVVGI